MLQWLFLLPRQPEVLYLLMWFPPSLLNLWKRKEYNRIWYFSMKTIACIWFFLSWYIETIMITHLNDSPGMIGLSISNDTNAVVIVTPAEGPSLLMAPFGKCTWISVLSIRLVSCPNPSWKKDTIFILDKDCLGLGYCTFLEFDRIQDNANVADSFITSPNCPVNTNSPSPFIFVASTTMTCPPTEVHAKPTATPLCPNRALVVLS